MTALTYGDTRVSTSKSKITAKAAPKAAPPSVVTETPRQGWFARFLAALMESRMRQAERDIRLYAPQIVPLLPALRRAQADANGSDTPRGGW